MIGKYWEMSRNQHITCTVHEHSTILNAATIWLGAVTDYEHQGEVTDYEHQNSSVEKSLKFSGQQLYISILRLRYDWYITLLNNW